MNLHLPQSEVTKTEIKELMMVADNVVSAQSNKPVMGIIQDSLLSVHKMTRQDVFLTKYEVMNLMMKIKYTDYKLPYPAILKPEPKWTGKQILNLILPKDLNFDKNITVQNGYYCDGEMCKKTLGTSEKGLIHTLWLKYGVEVTRLFMSNIQYICNHWILHNGFTVGIGDTITSKQVQVDVRKTIEESEQKVKQLISVSKHSENPEIFEKKINQVLNNAMAISGRIVQETISRKNNINTMVSGGSKGSVINIAQIMGVVGQQNVSGGRITLGYKDRTLCHFEKHDNNPAPKGFVKNSYYKGLDPHEFFYHAMSGREGITDTAVKSVTGDTLLMVEDSTGVMIRTIQDFVDTELEHKKEHVQYYDASQANMELLPVSGYKIATTDSYGHTSWESITKVTRHDPSEYIYRIQTQFGREVRVVESKSLLVWNGTTYEPKMTNEVKLGDALPTMKTIRGDHNRTFIDVRYLFDGYIFGSMYRGKDSRIKHGCIYPSSAKRNPVTIPEEFPLTYENGCFIGLYLAEGYSNLSSGKVCISNKNETILQFCSKWFEDHGMKHKTYTSHEGKSVTIQGYSRLMGKLLEGLCGKGAKCKELHPLMYDANDDFVKGLLSGYFSGNGTVGENKISCSSASANLMYGIMYFLNRFDIVGKLYRTKTSKLDAHRIDIRSVYAKRFAKMISLLHPEKQQKQERFEHRKTMLKYRKHYHEINDTILDPIISIEKELSHGQKVYDLTIPKTNNFGLANGLLVYDTADTGYIQRRLIKSMEDLKTEFDGTIRNSIGDILQFRYGDDGFNAIYLQRISFTVPSIGTAEFEKAYIYDDMELHEVQWFKEHQEFLNKKIEILSPIHVDYLNLEETYYIDKDIICYEDWQYEMEQFTNLLLEDTNTIKKELKQAYVPLVLYIRSELCSKRVIHMYQMSTFRFQKVMEKVTEQFMRSLIQQGEMIGTLAAQSLGEPTTQLTLNSFHFTGISAKNITLGVPRFKELINVLKNVKTPSMTIYTNGKNEEIVLELESCQLKDIIQETELIDVEDISEDISFISEHIHDIAIKINLNKKKMIEHNLSLLDIMIPIFKHKLEAVCSLDVQQTQEYIIVFVPNMNNDTMQDIDEIQNKVLKRISIKGIPEVTKCYLNENIIETDGSCFLKTLCIDNIDSTKTICNIPSEVLEVLGVEAAPKRSDQRNQESARI